MSRRREGRLLAVQFLFQRDFNPGDLEQALADFFESRALSAKIRLYFEEVIRGVEQHLWELDERLGQYAEHWDLKRMAAVDRNIMRVALYEMMFRTEIPPVVSINEAVELAKQFAGPESGRFVNGILDRARKAIQRPARIAMPDPRFAAPEPASGEGGGED